VSKNLQFDQLIKYIQTISALVDDAIKNNFTDEEIKAIAIPDEYKSRWFGLFFTPNLVIQYEQKNNEKLFSFSTICFNGLLILSI
jgi:hypothetical protein